MKNFITLNPHRTNLSTKNLLKNFRFVLQKYYRKTLGHRYYKHKDKQYPIAIFQEDGRNIDYKHPHLHILVDIPLIDNMKFYKFIKDNMKLIYPSLTAKQEFVSNFYDDLISVYKYCLKEGKKIVVNDDLYNKDYSF